MPLSEIAQQLSKLAEQNDIEGMAALLESWPVTDRGDDWAMGVEARMGFPSSTDDQKARMRVLWSEFEEAKQRLRSAAHSYQLGRRKKAD